MINFKRGLERIKAERGINQKDIGEKLGLSDANISRLLSKKDFRIHKDIEKIADALGYDLELYFVDRKSKKRIACD